MKQEVVQSGSIRISNSSADDTDKIARRHRVGRVHRNALDLARSWRIYGYLHLHGVENHERVTLGNNGISRDTYLHDGTRKRCRDLARVVRVCLLAHVATSKCMLIMNKDDTWLAVERK